MSGMNCHLMFMSLLSDQFDLGKSENREQTPTICIPNMFGVPAPTVLDTRNPDSFKYQVQTWVVSIKLSLFFRIYFTAEQFEYDNMQLKNTFYA